MFNSIVVDIVYATNYQFYVFYLAGILILNFISVTNLKHYLMCYK